MTWRSKLSYPQNTPTLSATWKMQMKISYIIGNKKYTNKKNSASLCKHTIYRLQSTAAKIKLCAKQNKKQKKSM